MILTKPNQTNGDLKMILTNTNQTTGETKMILTNTNQTNGETKMKNLITPQEGIVNMIDSGFTDLIVEGTPYADILRISEYRSAYLKSRVNSPGNNPLMLLSMEKDHLPIHYVYEHKDEEGVVVYVGMGIDGRAYEMTLRRKPDHSRWMFKQQICGRSFANILVGGHIRSTADKSEAMLIKHYQPKFNLQGK